MYSKINVIKDNLEEIIKLMNDNVPLSTISKKFNINYDTLKNNLINLGIDIKTNQGGKGISGTDYKPAMYYIENNIYLGAPKLKVKLFRDGLKEKRCECCGLTEWLGNPIPLELHHKNHNHFDNSLDNLEILCSNCHALVHGYSQ
jgi:hypothetical protein